MPGFLYIASVMSAGLLSVLLLALRTEKSRSKVVQEALAKLPGISPDRRLSAGRRGLAVDDRHQALCVICAETQTVRLNVVPFADVLASELWVDGRLVSRVERGSAVESMGRVKAAAQSTGEVRLRIETRDRHAPVHDLPIPDLRIAKYWQSQLRAMIAASESMDALNTGTLVRRTAAAQGVERRATVQPGLARKTPGVQTPPAERTLPVTTAAATAKPIRKPAGEVQEPVSPQLRAALRRYLSGNMPSDGRMVISERKLRDACAPRQALIHFHDQMNRLRRAKALADYRLSYSRKNETWRITRADERRAAA